MNYRVERFSLFVILLALLLCITPSVHAEIIAQEVSSPTVTIRAYDDTPSASNTASPKSDYTLPYPGLLPDSPLYFLKTLRDRVVSIFISNPRKKAEFNLLQCDKRINAAVYLLANHDKKKETLAVSTISKAENYMEEGIEYIKQARKQGEITEDVIKLYEQAAIKYLEVFVELEKPAAGDLKKQLQANESRIKNLLKQITALHR